MVRSNRDLGVSVGYAAAATALIWLTRMPSAVGLALLPLALIVPGYTLTRAIEGSRGFSPLEVVILSLTLSFATAVLGGLVLNWTPRGLDAESWSALFFLVSAVGGYVALARRDAGEAHADPFPRIRWPLRQVLILAVATALVAAAAGLAVRSQASVNAKPVTQLYVVPHRTQGRVAQIAVTVSNGGPQRVSYRVVLREGTGRVAQTAVRLPAGHQRTISRTLDPKARSVTVDLYRGKHQGRPFREVTVR
jgi:hypothetical protein